MVKTDRESGSIDRHWPAANINSSAVDRWETIRVFVSSTFRDMQAERETLVKSVFPLIRERLAAIGRHLEDIDLRWGIDTEKVRNEALVDFCLQQVERCRPFLIGLLGERYGWLPPAGESGSEAGSITELEILAGLREKPGASSQALIYLRDSNFLTTLPETLRSRFIDGDAGAARRLESLKERLRKEIGDSGRLVTYSCRYAGVRVNVRLVRELLSADEADRLLRLAPGGRVSPTVWEELEIALQQRLLEFCSVHLEGLEDFARRVREDLWRAICSELEAGRLACGITSVKQGRKDGESDAHELYMASHLRVFRGREDAVAELCVFADHDGDRPCLILGPPGIGKSALLARFVTEYRRTRPETLVLIHFAGANADSCRLSDLLGRFCRKISETLGFSDPLPTECGALCAKLVDLLARLSRHARVVLVADGLDHFPAEDEPFLLSWLPRQLPAHVKVILSSASGIDSTPAGSSRILSAVGERPYVSMSLIPLSDVERQDIVYHVPSLFAKTFSRTQLEYLVRNPATSNPLFLLVALEELRLFGSFEHLERRITTLPQGSEAVSALFDQVFERLEEDFDPRMVKEILTGLVCSRDGLSEEEILDFLFTSRRPVKERQKRSVAVQDSLALEAEPWEEEFFAFLSQLRPYFLRRGQQIDLFDAQLAAAVHRRYLGHQLTRHVHLRLARYFYRRTRRQHRFVSTDARALVELTYHLAAAGDVKPLRDLLLEFEFLSAKLTALGATSLLTDFDSLLRIADSTSREEVEDIARIRDALRLSAHILDEDSAQLGGQLWRWLAPEARSTLIRQLLARSGHRGFWLRPMADSTDSTRGPLRQTLIGHRGSVLKVVASRRDPRWVASGGEDGTVRIWDLSTGTLLRTLIGHCSPVSALALAEPVGAVLIASASEDETVKVWDIDAQAEVLTLAGHYGPVTAVALSPDGSRLVSTSNDERVLVWDVGTGEELHNLLREGADLYEIGTAIAITPDGRRAAVGSSSGDIVIWNLKDGRQLAVLDGHDGEVTALAVTPDGRRLLSSGTDGVILDWSLQDLRLQNTLSGHAGTIVDMTLLPDPNFLITLATDGTFREWHLDHGNASRLWPVRSSGLTAVAVTADTKLLITSATDHSLKVWDLESAPATTWMPPSPPLRRVVFSSDGSRCVSLSRAGILQTWDPATGNLLSSLHGIHQGLTLTPGGELLAASRRALFLFGAEQLQPVRCYEGHGGWIQNLVITPDGKRILTASEDRTLAVWDFWTSQLLGVLRGHERTVAVAAVSDDGSRAVSGSFDGTVKVWNLGTLTELHTLRGHDSYVVAVRISRDGCLAASASDDQTVRVWNLETGQELQRFTAHHNLVGIETLILSADGNRLVYVGDGNVLRVHDPRTGQLVHEMTGHRAEITDLMLNDDGGLLVSVSLDAVLSVWEIESGKRLASFNGDAGFTCCAFHSSRRWVAAGDILGRVWLFHLEEGRVQPVRVDLNVPYDDKDEAKRSGARWDVDQARWYLPSDLDVLKVRDWVPSVPRGSSRRPKAVHPLWLQVPYEEKEEAKALGARWDADARRWWVPSENDASAFERWLAPGLVTQTPRQKLLAPVYLLESIESCYKCGNDTTVVTIAAEGITSPEDRDREEPYFVVLSQLEPLPPTLSWHIADRFPGYFHDRSETVGGSYMMNHCSCGARQGDFYLNNDGGAFCAMDEEDASHMVLKPLPGLNRLAVSAAYSITATPTIALGALRYSCASMAVAETKVAPSVERRPIDIFTDDYWHVDYFEHVRLGIERGHLTHPNGDGLAGGELAEVGIAVLERTDLVLRERCPEEEDEFLEEDMALRRAALRALDAVTRTGQTNMEHFVAHMRSTLCMFGYLGLLDVRQSDVAGFWSRMRRRATVLGDSPHRSWFELLCDALQNDPDLVDKIRYVVDLDSLEKWRNSWQGLREEHGTEALDLLAQLGFRPPDSEV